MKKELAIALFVDALKAYENYLPKLKRVVEEFGMARCFVPHSEGETYSDLLERETHHFSVIYNTQQYEALQSHPMTDEEYTLASNAFFEDLKCMGDNEADVDSILNSK